MKKNALEQLFSLRSQRAQEASSQVARAQQVAEKAAERRGAQERSRERLEEGLQAEARQEQSQLGGGLLRAADLAQGAAWKVHASALRQQAEDAVLKAAADAHQAQIAVEQARTALADARAQARIAEEAARRLRARAEAQQQARAEEENEDRFAARQGLRTRG